MLAVGGALSLVQVFLGQLPVARLVTERKNASLQHRDAGLWRIPRQQVALYAIQLRNRTRKIGPLAPGSSGGGRGRGMESLCDSAATIPMKDHPMTTAKQRRQGRAENRLRMFAVFMVHHGLAVIDALIFEPKNAPRSSTGLAFTRGFGLEIVG